MKKLMKKSKRGFTLVELIIVIAILAIIAAIAIPTASNVIGNANLSADAANAQSIEMTFKTAQSEALANATTKSTIIEGLISAKKSKVTELLAAYNVTLDLDKLRTSDSEYYFDKTTFKVVAAADAGKAKTAMNIASDPDKLSSTSTFKFGDAGALEITP